MLSNLNSISQTFNFDKLLPANSINRHLFSTLQKPLSTYNYHNFRIIITHLQFHLIHIRDINIKETHSNRPPWSNQEGPGNPGSRNFNPNFKLIRNQTTPNYKLKRNPDPHTIKGTDKPEKDHHFSGSQEPPQYSNRQTQDKLLTRTIQPHL